MTLLDQIPTAEDLRALMGLFPVLLLFSAVEVRLRGSEDPTLNQWARDAILTSLSFVSSVTGLLVSILALSSTGMGFALATVPWWLAVGAIGTTTASALIHLLGRAHEQRPEKFRNIN